jgi:dienelactone hydrolase
MFMILRLIVLAALSLLTAPASAQQTFDPATAFGARPGVQSISLSPDGRTVAYVVPTQGQGAILYTADVDGTGQRAVIRVDGREQRLGSCGFVSNQRLVCSTYTIQEFDGTLLPVTRLVALNLDGSNTRELGQRNSAEQLYFRASSGSIIDYLPGNDNVVLMAQVAVPENSTGSIVRRSGEGLGVVRIDTSNSRTTVVETPRPRAISYISDGRGRVRIMAVRNIRSGGVQDSSVISFMYRRPGSDDWLDFGNYDTANGLGPVPVAVDPDLNVAYVFEQLQGRDAVYRVSLDGSMRRELVASQQTVDVDRVLRIGRRNRVVGATYATERREAIYFDPDLRQLAERLHRTLPNSPLINFEDASEDENRLLIWAGSDTDAGRYYIYDRTTRQLSPLFVVRAELENVRLAPVRPITYRAADGTQIPGYLTLPPGSSGRGLPAIVMPHGGPGARDEWGFDWLAQYYANRGYAVIQPNFRGSSGYGAAWFQTNGFRSWRVAVGDVNDAGRWLVSEGIADPARLAIVGWSYGGYAALQANVLDPALFRAVVAVAPVTDLGLAREEWRDFTNAQNVREFFGDGPHIEQGSPARNAGAFRAPVLMFHGSIDRNVGIRQSRLMDERLRAAGRQSELVIFPELDHQLDDASARARMLRRSDEFLRQALSIR